MQEKIAEAMEALGLYGARLQRSREVACKAYHSSEPEDIRLLRNQIDMLIAGLVTTVDKPIAGVNEPASYQISLSASYIRSHFLINNLIIEGNLQEASTLMRKQIESVARMNELDSKPLARLLKKTPNVGNFFKHGEGQMYGALSEAAHFGQPRISELLTVMEDTLRGIATVSVYPSYNQNAHTCFQMQHATALCFYGWIVAKLHDWYPVEDFAFELEMFAAALRFADKAGTIQLPPDLSFLKETGAK